MNGVMIMGTASDVGKSLVCTAICRLLDNDGIRVAPFKSQNLSPYMELTADGIPISRAQYIQAEAARTIATPDMNPIILQPGNNGTLTGTFCGEPLEPVDGMAYRDAYYKRAIQAIQQSLKNLSTTFDALVIEGAGSPVEMNLLDYDIVNMKVAELADVSVVLVADIDRGGVFASVVGTLELMEPAQRKRVKAMIINQFKGDPAGFKDGIEFLESYTGVQVIGVIPHKAGHGIQEEDAEQRVQSKAPKGVDPIGEWAAHVQSYIDWPFLKALVQEAD